MRSGFHVRLLGAVTLAALSFATASAQSTSTLCQAEEVVVNGTRDLRLIGCGAGFPDNVLWHLDRADSRDGSLDGTVTRRSTGKGAVVYLCDTGVKPDHDEFMRATGSVVLDPINTVPGAFDCLSPTAIQTPQVAAICTHGTSTASVVAGRNVGVAPDARIVPVVMGATVDEWLVALRRIVAHAWDPATPPFRTAVVSMSMMPGYAGTPRMGEVETKIREMIAGVDREGRPDPSGKRFVFVVIGGNLGPQGATSTYLGHCDAQGRVALSPATAGPAVDGLITVGGLDRANAFWSGSCNGTAIEILAPAETMFIASITGRDHYRSSVPLPNSTVPLNSGTSYAAPYVSGLAACLLEREPDLSPGDIERRIKSSAGRVSSADEPTAGGRVAVYENRPAPPRRRAVAH